MQKRILTAVLCLFLPATIASAGIMGSNNPNDFPDLVDWCQLGCDSAAHSTPEAWISAGGATGMVGLVDTQQQFFNLQQGSSWSGDFDNGIGLIYNGANFGNTPTDIAATFDQGVDGAGAFIQANYFGAFTATVTLFDINYQPLGTFTANGNSTSSPGNALFIGALYSSPDVWAIQFDAIGIGPAEPDFAIGTMGLATSAAASVPEPGSVVTLASALLGLAAFTYRRARGSK